MTSESKILTVSYGTFSCTLEGFDNPFDTMKAIAEYFRDLAAQDRHFGAEPPPPDAAMLHRLAEREVSRLATSRAAEAARAAEPAEAAVAEAPVAPRIQINPVNRRPAHPPVEPEAEVEDDILAPEPSLQDVIPDGVAAKLARIRRSVGPTVAEAAAPLSAFAAGPDLPEVSEEEDAIAAVSAEIEAEEAAELVAAPGAAEDVETVAAWLEEAAEAEAEAEAEEVAAVDAALVEDEIADIAPVSDDLTVAFAGEEIASDLDDGWDAEATIAEDEADEDLARVAALDGVAADAAFLDDALPEDLPADFALTEMAVEDPLPEAIAEEPVEAAIFEEPAEAEVAEEPVEAAVAEAEGIEVIEPAAEAPAEPAVAAEPEPPVARPGGRSRRVSSRVVRLHPDETPDADYDFGATRVLAATGESDEIARLLQQAEEVMAEDENRRRQEALSRLKAAVVSTEADRADIDYEAPKAQANLDPYRDDLAEVIQPDLIPEPPAAPEVKPRRKSVNIRPAEPRPGTIRPGMISPPPLVLVSEQRIDRVGPAAAPAAAPAPAKAPVAPGISPAPEGQPMIALRTGRLSGAIGAGAAAVATSIPARNVVLEKPSYGTAAEADEDDDLAEDSKELDETGLAAFAEMVGAKSMAEMLEAAAAYATCVEKRSQFTRPQLMRRMVASAGGKPVSREDGLRSFGTLLRTGRIEKVTRGHYSLADNSPYLAEARRLA